jgi:hypothetical protein
MSVQTTLRAPLAGRSVNNGKAGWAAWAYTLLELATGYIQIHTVGESALEHTRTAAVLRTNHPASCMVPATAVA